MSTQSRPTTLLKTWTRLPVLALGLMLMTPADAQANSRLKDIADFEGVRDNQLIGYGLVVGLNGTGDSLTNSPFTKQSLIGMLERLGVNIRNDNINISIIANSYSVINIYTTWWIYIERKS